MPKARIPALDSSESIASDNPLTWWGTLLIFWDTLSSTALSRCWPSLIGISIWSSSICILNYFTHGKLSIQPTLITVFGTVLGFVVSFRTSSSFERYNEGRKLWSQIVLNCRIFARIVWFHIPDNAISDSTTAGKSDQEQAETLVEKKTVVNLLQAYAVAVKHYLRGEEGIHYEDLYPLVPFLSSCHYSFPAIIPSTDDQTRKLRHRQMHGHNHDTSVFTVPTTQAAACPTHQAAVPGAFPRPIVEKTRFRMDTTKTLTPPHSNYDQESLLPAESPPSHRWRAAFPFPFFLWVWGIIKKCFCKLGADDACQNFHPSKNNVPLEISLYLTSYISALQTLKTVDNPTLALLYTTLNQLVDALTGLERILTTPIPFSYSSHLWTVTMVYCTTLPFQLWSTLEWFTIPASMIASFVFFGFVVAGEEIENPFGYDKNDLNMGFFVENIIRKELHAITATPAPNPATWAFLKENNFLQVEHYSKDSPDKTPVAWVRKGKEDILSALHGTTRSFTSDTI